jgi:predicted membrane-bound spermidine synthase
VFGNVLGGLLTGFVLLPMAGTERTLLAFGLLGLMFGLALRSVGRRIASVVVRFACISLLAIAAVASFPRPGELYAAMHTPPFAGGTARFVEGFDSVVFTWQNGEQMRNYINGQGHGYRPGPLYYAEAIEGLTFAPNPRRVLVIGFGAGSTTEAALLPPEVQQVTLVELSGSLIENLRNFPVTKRILDDRRVNLAIDDGRRFLERSGEKFDAILMDPLRTTTAYSNNLHSRQFFSLCARHLTDGGVLMVGGVGDDAVIPRTVVEEFPHVRVYPSFSLASKTPMRQNRERLERMLGSFDAEMQAAIWSLAQDAIDGRMLAAASSAYPTNNDWHPASEYYLGMQFRRLLSRLIPPHP